MTSTALPVVPATAWARAIAEIEPGAVLVLGAPGVGKSVFSRFVVGQLDRAPGRVALLDCDPGQAGIGVPTCLGLALTSPWQAPAAQWFVGDVTLDHSLLPVTLGAGRLNDRAREEGARTVIIDTPGFVDTGLHRALLYHLAVACKVKQVIAIAAKGELDPAIDLLSGQGLEILMMKPSPVSIDPQHAGRARARKRRLDAHFFGSRARRFGPDRFVGADWRAGIESTPEPGRIVGMIDQDGFCLGLGFLRRVGVDSIVVDSPLVDDPRLVKLHCGRRPLSAGDVGLELEVAPDRVSTAEDRSAGLDERDSPQCLHLG